MALKRASARTLLHFVEIISTHVKSRNVTSQHTLPSFTDTKTITKAYLSSRNAASPTFSITGNGHLSIVMAVLCTHVCVLKCLNLAYACFLSNKNSLTHRQEVVHSRTLYFKIKDLRVSAAVGSSWNKQLTSATSFVGTKEYSDSII